MFHLLKRSRGSCCLGLLAATTLTSSLHAADIHVPGDFPTIAIALNNASNGDTIIVAPGTYFETIDLGSKRVSLIGSGGADVTMIDAFALNSCLRITGGQMLDTVIDGLTFTGGLAHRGGGIFINGASATIRNCRFADNDAVLSSPGGDPGDGGGLFIETGTLVLQNCEFLNNVAADTGGGAYFRTGTTVAVTNCHFEGNVALHGAGMATLNADVEIFDTTLLMNGTTTETERGGGLQASGGSVHVDRCRFEGNTIYDDGLAVMARAGSQVELRNSLFLNNEGADGATPNAAIYSEESGTSVDLMHCTMVGNMAPGTSALRAFAGGEITFQNGIIWGNIGVNTISSGGSGAVPVAVSYSVIQDGYAGVGNISIDPMLDAQFALMPGSPAIDAGDSNVLLGEDPRDYAMNPRAVNDPDTAITGVPVYGLTADMGAFEFQPEGGEPICPGDLDGDGAVSVTDLLQLIGAWGFCP